MGEKKKTENVSVNQSSVYDLKSVKLPYLSGMTLGLFISMIESPLRALFIPSFFESAGLTWLRKLKLFETPTMYPAAFAERWCDESIRTPVGELPIAGTTGRKGYIPASSFDYTKAYLEKKMTPVDVAERLIWAVANADSARPPLLAMKAFYQDDILKQAEASARRWRMGSPIGLLDGVPVAVKDELDMVPYPTGVGTAFLGVEPALADATSVARLRAAGALLFGKAAMHEIGIGVTGLNVHQGTPRNPYSTACYTGGSSSGSAAAVSAGFCPIAIGADGGGSIRIPSAFCGVTGLKPTFGRVSELGAAPLCWSVAHVGPIGASVADVALAYGIIAGPDSGDPMSMHQPPPTLAGWNHPGLTGITLGIFRPWFEHADSEVVSSCSEMVESLKKAGAVVREVEIPGLEAARVAHTVTIASEMARSLERYYDEHRKKFNADVRINLALAKEFTATDYLQAQRVRTRIINAFLKVFTEVDAVITPATGVAAPAIKDAAIKHGESDITTLMEIMRFATPGNLTGMPAISFPAGYTKAGLPVGMQAMGRPWEEPLLLRIALAAERSFERRRPSVSYDLLKR